MKTANISDVTQEEFDSAVQTVISGIKSSDPKLDTRLGTVLRSLLVNPEARIEATTAKQIDYVRKSSSLKTLQEAEAAGEQVDVDDVNAVMSNFSIKAPNGTFAEGIVKITVEDGSRVYSVTSGTVFKTVDGLSFTSVSDVVAAVSTDSGAKSSLEVNSTLYQGAAGYFFLVPVKADNVGAEYNIVQGTSLTMDINLYTLTLAEAYTSFCGGSDVADLQEVIKKIPAGLSIRGFVNKNACEGMLRDKFDEGQYPILACSTVGYGNPAQRRDKHNIFGIGVGGRIDLYVRNFGDLYTITKIISGTREITTDTDNNRKINYVLNLSPDDFPGSCWVKDISITSEVNSSLDFTCVRTSYNTSSTWHDFNVKEDTSETFNTIWQGLKATVIEVPPADVSKIDNPTEDDKWPEERLFRVSVYCLPQIKELQEYVDSDDIRSVSTDVVIRCPIICNMAISATVVYDVDNPMDPESTKYKIRKYINSLGFVKSITRSEIVHILKSCGALSVDLSRQDMLYGVLHDAHGKEYKLTGDSLTVDGLADDSAMLSKDTAVFAVEPENIQLTLIPSK